MATPDNPQDVTSSETCHSSLVTGLYDHLAWWGLKRFTSDAEYFAWQRQQLSSPDLNRLKAQIERKRIGDGRDEVAFYDQTAQPQILPALYSQRYEYYIQIGPRIASRIGQSQSIFDFGCGVGILTTFYAKLFPGRKFIGVDRSPVSIDAARQKAKELGLGNVRFECHDLETEALSESYELVLATHALLQAEQDPGIPSLSWQTFERSQNRTQQTAFEQRTGIDRRLDRLAAVLPIDGRMIVFEKTRQLARRIPLQRALTGRGLYLVEQPEGIRYQLVEEVVDDGPFYVMRKGNRSPIEWDESPEPDEGAPFEPTTIHLTSSDPEAPLYENHWPSAQRAWERLSDRKIAKEATREGSDGRQMHVEVGTTEGLAYLYCANTFDQRQLVIVEPAREAMLESYYQEILGGMP